MKGKIIYSFYIIFFTYVMTVLLESCQKDDELKFIPNEAMSGGKQTSFITGSAAFSQIFPYLSSNKAQLHEIGDVAFEAVFNSDPNQLNYGLGPIYNNVSCASCHVGDGRGKAPESGQQPLSLLLRISTHGEGAHGEPKAVPFFGGQLQPRHILNVLAEADVNVSYTYSEFMFSDGEKVTLRRPIYSIVNPYRAFPGDAMISPRLAMPVFGLGLLENISNEDILKLVDENDANGDGISGKANWVWDVINNKKSLGRFGWKAGQPNIIQQSAGAYNEDMGITNYIFPIESSSGQSQFPTSLKPKEVSDSLLYAVAYYLKTLAVPARRNVKDLQVLSGQTLFQDIGCGKCHNSSFQTMTDVVFPEVSNTTIYPFTDLLLHDMGADLADYRPEFLANGFEWRTSPLWGIGLTKAVNGHNNFLHDGRAQSLTEAILWHGGEAEKSKIAFTNLSKKDRQLVIKFLESL